VADVQRKWNDKIKCKQKTNAANQHQVLMSSAQTNHHMLLLN